MQSETEKDEKGNPKQMIAKTSNLNEDLGRVREKREREGFAKLYHLLFLSQIQHIFSDKTGTLTKNQMTFRMASIHGHVVVR